MSKKQKKDKKKPDPRVHAALFGSKFKLCKPREKGNVSKDSTKIDCLDCARAAQGIVQRLEAEQAQREAERRQEAALASGQPPHWTEAKLHEVRS
jgi:hypothetical protein